MFLFFIKTFNLDVFYKLERDVSYTHSYLRYKTYKGVKASRDLEVQSFLSDAHPT